MMHSHVMHCHATPLLPHCNPKIQKPNKSGAHFSRIQKPNNSPEDFGEFGRRNGGWGLGVCGPDGHNARMCLNSAGCLTHTFPLTITTSRSICPAHAQPHPRQQM